MKGNSLKFILRPVLIFSQYVQVFAGTLSILLFLLLSMPATIYRWFVIQIAIQFRKELGSILSFMDLTVDDEPQASEGLCPVPKNSIIMTLTLDGTLEVSELRKLFKKNVIETGSYTKLQQYVSNFMGYRFWKQEENFLLENHVVQLNLPKSLENLHEALLNRPFPPKRSPWELVLIKDEENFQTILGLKISHAMVDGKSATKLLVNQLGQKPFEKKAVVAVKRSSLLHKMMGFIPTLISVMNTSIQGKFHPWKNFDGGDYSVAFSTISLADIKMVARKNNVSGSAVIMSVITGAIHKLHEENHGGETLCVYPLPKGNHPDKEMKNHLYLAVISLPTVEPCSKKRVIECHQGLLNLKKNQEEIFLERLESLESLPGPLRRVFPKNEIAPIVLTNNVGSKESFEIGGIPVSKFCASLALLEGSIGLGFYTLSYGDQLNISVIAKGKTVSRRTLNALAKGIGMELENLKGLEE